MKVKRITDVKLPERGTPYSAGLDFFIPETFNNGMPYVLAPTHAININSGILAEIPANHMFLSLEKSGIATKKGLIVGAKVVDEDYQGEIHLHVINVSNKSVLLTPGDKIVQFVLVPVLYEDVEEVDEIHKVATQRGKGAFGSTGNK